jgi:hypothetical protein
MFSERQTQKAKAARELFERLVNFTLICPGIAGFPALSFLEVLYSTICSLLPNLKPTPK